MIAFVFYFSLAMVVLVPLQALSLKYRAQTSFRAVTLNVRIWFSILSVASGLVAAASIGYVVMFGPSYITGDYVGLPWLTWLPALVIGLWAGIKANHLVLAVLFARSDEILK
ncbi:MAG: hypothetical protein IPM03_06570 [Sulfuritalea sp.]|nr:hypothetical protein [Sulfuritalea sp.]